MSRMVHTASWRQIGPWRAGVSVGLAILALLCAGAKVSAQEVDASKVYLTTCLLLPGSGSPEGAVSAPVCSTYWRTDTGDMYRKTSGTGNTGWTIVGSGFTPAPLTKADDTNVTLTLGGTPATALLQATSITAGWAGQLALARGGTAANLTAAHGAVPYSTATAFGLVAPGSAGQLFQSAGGASPAWTTATYPNVGTASASYLRADGTNWIASTLKLPNAATSTSVPVATSTNTYGEDSDLTFAMDTLTATKAQAPTWLKSPLVYAYGSAGSSLTLGGTGVVGCGSPPTAANCEAIEATYTSVLTEQRLTTDTTYRTRWYVGTDGGHVEANNSTGWLPLKLSGTPVEIHAGGFHVGSTSITNPGLGNTALDGYIGSPGYVSQTTGWRITADGSADFSYLFTQEMHAKKFIADVEIALLGGVLVTKSQAKLAVAALVPAKGSIVVLTVKDIPDSPDVAVYEANDVVMIRQFTRTNGGLSITNACGTVTGYTDLADGLQTWNFQRFLGTDGGAMAEASITMPVDSLILDFGVTGGGYYEISAADGVRAVNAPYAQTIRWTGTSPCVAANLTVTSRVGQLKGITATSEYGALLGTYGATSAGRYVIFSDQHAEIHNVPLSLYSESNQTLYLDPVLSSFGQATSSASGLTYSSGTGCWSGIDAGTFKWRCGNPSGHYIQWNGSTLNVNGNITVTGLIAEDTNNVAGVASATVASGASRAMLGLNASGNPALPAIATPSGSGLFLGSDYLGYYTAGVWKTFMNSTGGFYLGGTGGALQWNGTTLAITGSITITGGSGYANISDKPTLGTISTLNEVVLGTNTSGGYATSATEGGNAADTMLVDGTAAATVKGGAVRANTGLDGSGYVVLPVRGSVIGSAIGVTGLNLTSTYLGYYDGVAWKTFMDSSGNFYLGGTGGALQWVAASGTLTIAATLSGNGSGITSITGGNISAATVTVTQLNISTLSAITANLGTVTAGSIAVVNGVNTIGFAPSVSPSIYAGPTGAPTFSVTPAGALTATNATITGAFTATSGDVTAAITAGSITSAMIAANTIVAADIAASTITAGQIAASTITTTQIAANTIVAGNLNVATLSAISANLGTVTAGTVTGVTLSGSTIYAGSGNEVTLNIDGVQIISGVGDRNKIRWSDGSWLKGASNTMDVYGPVNTVLWGGTTKVYVGFGAFYPSGTVNLGITEAKWSDVLADKINGATGITANFGVNDSDCVYNGRRSLFFTAGILVSANCQSAAPEPVPVAPLAHLQHLEATAATLTAEKRQ